jgi:hypothetical protein
MVHNAVPLGMDIHYYRAPQRVGAASPDIRADCAGVSGECPAVWGRAWSGSPGADQQHFSPAPGAPLCTSHHGEGTGDASIRLVEIERIR